MDPEKTLTFCLGLKAEEVTQFSFPGMLQRGNTLWVVVVCLLFVDKELSLQRCNLPSFYMIHIPAELPFSLSLSFFLFFFFCTTATNVVVRRAFVEGFFFFFAAAFRAKDQIIGCVFVCAV